MRKKSKKSKPSADKPRKKSKQSKDEYIGFKLIKPVSQSELLPDYEKIKNLNLPSALKANIIASFVPKETIDIQSNNQTIERDQYQFDTSIKTKPVSELDQYQNETSITREIEKKEEIPEGKQPPPSEQKITPIKIKQIPDITNEKLKFKPGFFSQWEISIFNELRKALSNSEFKIYTALFEESWTYGRNLTNIIGYKTLSEKTGLARATVIRCIDKLLKRKIIEKRTSFNNLGTIYKVNLPENAEVQLGHNQTDQKNTELDQSQNDTSTGIKMIPVLVSKRYQSPPNLPQETIENQSILKNQNTYNINYIHINKEKETIANQSKPIPATTLEPKLPILEIRNDDKFIFENNLIQVLSHDEIRNTLKSKPFSLKDEIIEMLLKTASAELISLKIQNALFNYRKNITKKPGEWLILSIYNNYKTTKQFLKYLKEKLHSAQRKSNAEPAPNPLDENLIKTVFGYQTKFLRSIPTKEFLHKELQKFNIPEQTISKIINTYPPEYIFFQIKHAEFRLSQLKDPTSWLINAITKVYKPSREFAKLIENQIKQIEEEKINQERNKKIEEERKKIDDALRTFRDLPKNKQEEIVKKAEEELKKINITPEAPGYQINLEFKIAQIILEKIKKGD